MCDIWHHLVVRKQTAQVNTCPEPAVAVEGQNESFCPFWATVGTWNAHGRGPKAEVKVKNHFTASIQPEKCQFRFCPMN